MSNTIVQAGGLSELAEICALHRQVFPQGILTQFGQKCLETYYSRALSDSHKDVIVAIQDSVPVGWVVWSTSDKAPFSHVLLLSWPQIVARIVLRRLKISVVVGAVRDALLSEKPSIGYADIEYIGVHPAYRRQGVARLMVQDVMRRAKDLGIPGMTTRTTDHNSQIIRVYEELGSNLGRGNPWRVGQNKYVRVSWTL